MNNKYLIMVYVPLVEKEFNVYIPIVKKVGTVKNLIIKIVNENTDGIFPIDNTKNLYNKETGVLLDDNLYVKNSPIRNGSRLILY